VNQKKLRILLLNYRDISNPAAGGAEVHLHEIFKRVAGMGHDVHLLCSGFSGANPEEIIDGINITRIGREWHFNFSAQYYLLKTKCDAYDLIIEDVNKIPIYSPKLTRTPVMLIIPHLFGTTVFQEASVPIGLYVYLWELLMPAVYRNLQIEVISESTREDLVNRGFNKKNIHVIYCGINTEIYFPDDKNFHDPGYPYIVCIGRLKKYKRFDLVLKAFRNLCDGDTETRLLVIGDGDHSRALKQLAASLGILERVLFRGHTTDREKVRLLRGAKFVVNTSPKEGWGLTNIEAQACGTPVIASNSPGLRESVRDGETGLLVPHGDIHSLTRTMKDLLSDSTLRDSLSRGALGWVGGFSWDRSADETIEMIHRITFNPEESMSI